MKEKEYFSEHGNWFSSLELDASWARSPWRSAETLRKSKIKMPCDEKCPSVFLTVDGKKYLFFNGWRLHWYIGPIDTLLGVFTWRRGDFRAGASSLRFPVSWLYICLHDTATKCHAGLSHPGVSLPRLLYQGENFTSVRNLPTVSCKRESTTRFGFKSVCR